MKSEITRGDMSISADECWMLMGRVPRPHTHSVPLLDSSTSVNLVLIKSLTETCKVMTREDVFF